MWRYIFYCFVVLNFLESVQSSQKKYRNENTNELSKQTEIIFTDVIKNISRVNNVLQDLINNYEQLQKIYNSQENIKSEYSDSEIDEVYKTKNKGKERSVDVRTTKGPIPGNFAATQIFWNDDKDDDSDEEPKELKEKDTVKSAETYKSNEEGPNIKNVQVETTTTEIPFTFSEESSDESVDATREVTTVKPSRLKTIHENNIKQLNPEILFVDTHTSKEVKLKVEPHMQFVGEPLKPKTRYSKIDKNQLKQESYQREAKVKTLVKPTSNHQKIGLNKTKNVKQLLYSESFSPKKIWDDIIHNKPIQLEAHSGITMETLDNDDEETGNFKSRKDGKKDLVILTENNKSPKNTQDGRLTEHEESSKEELKANALRKAYGDACLKLVVRKCYKACKKVLKAVCMQVTCKRSIKVAFDTYSKTGCIKQFGGNGIEEDGDAKKTNEPWSIEPFLHRRKDKPIVHITGEAYAACLPGIYENTKTRRLNEAPTNAETKNLNILRDRFEKACKQTSSNKCKDACTFAYTKACTEQTCSPQMKKHYKKSCRQLCNTAYELYKKDSESDSDSDSDTDE